MKRAFAVTSTAIVSAILLCLAAPAMAADDPSAKAQAIADKAVEFLKTQQQADGSWQTPRQPPGFTAIALRAIVGDGKYNSDTDFVKKGYDKLLSYQVDNGGIFKDQLANYNTAIAVMALSAANNPAFKDRIDKAVAYLKSLQFVDTIQGGPKGDVTYTPDNPWYGGTGYGREGRPDGSNTHMMLDALHDAGVPNTDPAFKAALKFVSRMQNLSETNDQPWAGNDGGAIYSPANGGETKAGEYTDANGKRMLRSYGSMTYAMLKSYIYAGLTKDDPRVKAAWDWISKNWTVDENPGMAANGPANAQNGMYYYYLTLARALDAYDQPVITDSQGKQHDWRVELVAKLGTLQKADGSFVGEAKWMEDSPVLATSYTAIAVEAVVKDLKEHPAK